MDNEIKFILTNKLDLALKNLDEFYNMKELQNKKMEIWDLWYTLDEEDLKDVSNYDINVFEDMIERM